MRLPAVNYNNRSWSWLLDPNMPPEPPVIPKVSASSKIQPASELEEPARERILLIVNLEKSRVSGWTVPAKEKRARAQSSRAPRLEVAPGFLLLPISGDYFSHFSPAKKASVVV